jgi:hypothetical protein
VYNLPLVKKQPPPPSVTEEVEMVAAAADAEEEAACKTNRQSRRGRRNEDWTLVSSRHKVNAAKEQLSDRYCAVLASFRRGQHILAVDRVREWVPLSPSALVLSLAPRLTVWVLWCRLSKARHDHREAQRQWAHDFFLAHEEHLKCVRARLFYRLELPI